MFFCVPVSHLHDVSLSFAWLAMYFSFCPMQQTVVPAGASSDMLDTVPVRNVRGLGGKLGEAVVSWSKAETASDLKVVVARCCYFG